METNKHKTYARIKQRKVLASYIITLCTSEQIAGVGCALHPPAFAAGSSGQGSARLMLLNG